MSDAWPDTTLNELATITMGQSPEATCVNTAERGLPFLQGCAEFGARTPIAKLYCSPPLRVAKSGSVLISVRAPVGTTNVADQDYCIGRGLGAVAAKQSAADTIFLLHAIEHNVDFLHRRSWGSTFLAIGSRELSALPVPALPLGPQRRIAEILSALDVTIEQTEALIAKYQQIKAGLMHDLFTRGVTPDGKLRPTRAEAPQLYKESPLGWIPKEWEVVPAGQMCQLITKGTTPALFLEQEESWSVPYIRVQNLSFDGALAFEEDQTFISSVVSRGELARSRVLPNDILMNIVGPPLGKISIVPDEYPEWNVNQAIAIFRTKVRENTQYLSFYLLSNIAQSWLLSRAKRTSGQVNLTLEMCRDLPVPFSLRSGEQITLTGRLASAEDQIRSETLLLNKLRQQKHGLMHDLLTGRVRVKVDA